MTNSFNLFLSGIEFEFRFLNFHKVNSVSDWCVVRGGGVSLFVGCYIDNAHSNVHIEYPERQPTKVHVNSIGRERVRVSKKKN